MIHMRSLVCGVVALLLLTPSVGGELLSVKLSVDPGDTPRAHSPLKLSIPAGELPADTQLIGILSADDEAIPVQVHRVEDRLRLDWVHPPIVRPRDYRLVIRADDGTTPRFRFIDGDGVQDLYFADTPILRHVARYDPADHGNTSKPFHHVFAFHDDGFITKGPGGRYPHHRGLYLGYNKTPFGDFWHCREVSQRHQHYLRDKHLAGPVGARQVSVTNWIARDGVAVVRDTRKVRAWRVAPRFLVLDFDVKLEALTFDPIELTGDAHHSGFHFRADNEIAETEGASFIHTPGARQTGNDLWSDANWTHASFELRGHRYHVTHFDHPDNPRPVVYSTRAYGRFGSFSPATLHPLKPLYLRYRIIIRDTAPEAEQLEMEYETFASPPSVFVK